MHNARARNYFAQSIPHIRRVYFRAWPIIKRNLPIIPNERFRENWKPTEDLEQRPRMRALDSVWWRKDQWKIPRGLACDLRACLVSFLDEDNFNGDGGLTWLAQI